MLAAVPLAVAIRVSLPRRLQLAASCQGSPRARAAVSWGDAQDLQSPRFLGAAELSELPSDTGKATGDLSLVASPRTASSLGSCGLGYVPQRPAHAPPQRGWYMMAGSDSDLPAVGLSHSCLSGLEQ